MNQQQREAAIAYTERRLQDAIAVQKAKRYTPVLRWLAVKIVSKVVPGDLADYSSAITSTTERLEAAVRLADSNVPYPLSVREWAENIIQAVEGLTRHTTTTYAVAPDDTRAVLRGLSRVRLAQERIH